MSGLIAAAGLLLAVEGALYALFPAMMKAAAAAALATPDERLRVLGLVSACLGVMLVWFVRG